MQEEQKIQKNSLADVLRFLIISAIVVYLVRSYVAQPFIVSGASMDPTFKTGEYLIVDELTYMLKSPERGDVIIFNFPLNPKSHYIKRIIGLPQEKISIRDGKVTIFNESNKNGITLNEDYLDPKNFKSDNLDYTLDEGEYFVMGDNRRESSDSRMWGAVPENHIVGRPILRLLPASRIGILPGSQDL